MSHLCLSVQGATEVIKAAGDMLQGLDVGMWPSQVLCVIFRPVVDHATCSPVCLDIGVGSCFSREAITHPDRPCKPLRALFSSCCRWSPRSLQVPAEARSQGLHAPQWGQSFNGGCGQVEM